MTLEARALLDVAPSQWLRGCPVADIRPPQMGRPEMVVKRMAGRDWREDWRERLHGRRAVARQTQFEILAELAEQGSVPPLGGRRRAVRGPNGSLVMEYVRTRTTCSNASSAGRSSTSLGGGDVCSSS
jgi:hypothetical protein